MTLPQDGRSPRQQQRFVEIYNAGSQALPAFGALEVVDSTQPDGDDSRTVFHVRRPTGDSLQQVLFNSHQEVASGQYGWASADYPVWALCDSTSPGTVVGTAEDSFELASGQQGFVVYGGSYNGATRIGVTPKVKGDLFSLLCGDMDYNFTGDDVILQSNSTYDLVTGQLVDDADVGVPLNRFKLAGQDGDAVLLKWSEFHGKYLAYAVERHALAPVVDVWDQTSCLSQAKLRMWGEYATGGIPVQGCKIFDWTTCVDSSSGAQSGLVGPPLSGAGGSCNLAFTFTVSGCGSYESFEAC